jgi:hypothetical protein
MIYSYIFIHRGERRLSNDDSSVLLLLSVITQTTRTSKTSGAPVRSQSPSDANKKNYLRMIGLVWYSMSGSFYRTVYLILNVIGLQKGIAIRKMEVVSSSITEGQIIGK